MKQRAKKISIPEIEDSLKDDLTDDSRIFIDKSMNISNRIFEFITINKWTQKILADKMDKSEAEISKLLSGTHNYTLRMISKIESVLGIDVIVIPDMAIPVFKPEPDWISSYTEQQTEVEEKHEIEWKNEAIIVSIDKNQKPSIAC